jgi:hypothetical protein
MRRHREPLDSKVGAPLPRLEIEYLFGVSDYEVVAQFSLRELDDTVPVFSLLVGEAEFYD